MVHPSACPYTQDSGGGWTWGNNFLLFFFGGLALYVGVGATFRYRQLEMRGVEVLPHLDFWRELPVLVADGAGFAMAKGAELVGGLGGEGAGVSRYVSHAAAGFQPIG